MSITSTVWVCMRHWAVAQRIMWIMSWLTMLDKGVILMVLPPKDEEEDRHWDQLSLLSCEICEGERGELFDRRWTAEPWWKDVVASGAKPK